MSETKEKKGSLPHGWVVVHSSSYKDRVYYFNKNTGVSSWELPKLLEPKDTKEMGGSKGKGDKGPDTDASDGRAKLESSKNVKKSGIETSEDKTEKQGNGGKVVKKGKSDSKGKGPHKDKCLTTEKRATGENLEMEESVKIECKTQKDAEGKNEDLEEGEVVDSEEDSSSTSGGVANAQESTKGTNKDNEGTKGTNKAQTKGGEKQQSSSSVCDELKTKHRKRISSKESLVQKIDKERSSDAESSSPSKRSRHSDRRSATSKNDRSLPKRESSRSVDSQPEKKQRDTTSKMKLPSARELGMKPPKLDKPLRRPRTSSVGTPTVGPALAPQKRVSASVDRRKNSEASTSGEKSQESRGVVTRESRKDSFKSGSLVNATNISKDKAVSKDSQTVSNAGYKQSALKNYPGKNLVKENSRGEGGSDVNRVNKDKTSLSSQKRNFCDDSKTSASESSLKKVKQESDQVPEKLSRNQRKKRAKVVRKIATLAANLGFAQAQIQKVLDTPEERLKLEALRKSQNVESPETPKVIVQDRPVLKAVRRLHTFGETVKPDNLQKADTSTGNTNVNSDGPLGPILDSMKPRSLRVNAPKPEVAGAAAIDRSGGLVGNIISRNIPTGSKLVKPQLNKGAYKRVNDTKLNFTVAPLPKPEIRTTNLNVLNQLNATAVEVAKSDQLSGGTMQHVVSVPIGTSTVEQFGTSANHGTSPAEFSFKNTAVQNQNISVEQKVVQNAALDAIGKSGGLFGMGKARNLFGKGDGLFGKGTSRNVLEKLDNAAVRNEIAAAGSNLDLRNQNVSPAFDLEPKLPDFWGGVSPLSSPEAMQEDISFVPIHRPITPELPVTMDSQPGSTWASGWPVVNTPTGQHQVFQTPNNMNFARNALSDPMPNRTRMNISPFEAALGIGNATYTEDMVESMDIDSGPLTEMTPVNNTRFSRVQLRGLADAVPQDQKLFIVLDTNVLMQRISFIEDIRDRTFGNLGKPMVIIPWVVMQELDALKDNKRPDRNSNTSLKAETEARQAVKFLHMCFQSRHPRVVGQTPREAACSALEGFKIESNDDRVLLCCVQCKEKYSQSLVVLFTNDINLCSKALIMGIEAFTHENLENGINNYSGVTVVEENQPVHFRPCTPTVDPTPKKIDNTKKLADDLLCELKDVLHVGLSIVLRSEMQAAYDDDWESIVFKRPPWTLSDVLQSINKHWIAVFGNVFGRDLECHVNLLVKHFKSKHGFGIGFKEVCGLIYNGIALYEAAKTFKSHNVPDKFERWLQNLHTLRKICQGILRDKLPNDSDLADLKEKVLSPVSETMSSAAEGAASEQYLSNDAVVLRPMTPNVPMGSTGQQLQAEVFTLRQKDFETVQNKFQQLWENINHFCDLLTQVFQVPKGAPLPPGLPSRDESVVFFAKLLPCIFLLKNSYLNMVMSTPDLLESQPQVFLALCDAINAFFVKLDIQITSAQLEPSQLELFYSNNEKREVLCCGYSQLEEMIKRLQLCDTQLVPEERLIVHGAN